MSDLASRLAERGSLPMPMQKHLIASTFDMRITSALYIHILAYMSTATDAAGIVVPDASGRLASDPDVIAEDLGISKAAIFRAFGRLEELGYIHWERARGNERALGVTGRVRFVLPE